MKLIICEKPSLALNVAKAIGRVKKMDGYFYAGEYIVTFAFGHLFTLMNVDDYLGSKKKWYEVPLPYIPSRFRFKIKDDGGVKKQVEVIENILKTEDISEVINCGDADREGQIIIDTIFKYLRVKLPIKRLWLPEQTPSTIKKQLNNLEDNNNYLPLQQEGYARAYMDWLLGINLTRHVSLKKGTLLRVGRVIIPIVKHIYDRDREIAAFVPTSYMKLISEPTVKLEVKKRFLKPEELTEKKNELNSNKALVKDIKKKLVKKSPKKLFSLSKLQSELSSRYKINFETSLKHIQSLYEDGYITYPRTNTQYLAEKEISKISEICSKYPNIKLKVKKNKKIFDDSKIDSHSAITITTKVENGRLKGIDKKIYDTIFNRFISNFLDEETIIASTTIEIVVASEIFKLKGEVIEKEGFFKYEPEKLSNNLPNLEIGDTFDVDFNKVDKETTPPSKITETTLSNHLKNPFKDRDEDEDDYSAILEGVEIGTEATRTGIIEKCIREGYISRDGQRYSIEEGGHLLIDTLDKLEINMYKEKTVEFSKMLKMVYREKLSLKELIEKTKEELSEIISKDISIVKLENKNKQDNREVIGKCPKCGGSVYLGTTKTGKQNYYCGNYKEGCKFTLWSTMKFYGNEIKIPKTKAKSLLKSDRTKFKLKNKIGEPYEAFLMIDIVGDYVNLKLNGFTPKKK